MKVQVVFWVGGQTFKETYVVSNLKDAKKTAEQSKPHRQDCCYEHSFLVAPNASYTTAKSARRHH